MTFNYHILRIHIAESAFQMPPVHVLLRNILFQLPPLLKYSNSGDRHVIAGENNDMHWVKIIAGESDSLLVTAASSWSVSKPGSSS